MLAKYGVGAQRAAPAPARHALYPKTTLYSASINKTRPQRQWVSPKRQTVIATLC